MIPGLKEGMAAVSGLASGGPSAASSGGAGDMNVGAPAWAMENTAASRSNGLGGGTIAGAPAWLVWGGGFMVAAALIGRVGR